MFELVIFDLDDALQDGGVVLGVGVHLGLDAQVGLGLVHFDLDLNDFLKHCENVALCVFNRIEENVAGPQTRHKI